ncbi:MAG: class I SAM-dependent methyltransferase [Candidatus Omnitrophica bacterium]|nr:class I SAM-dependent methyltransferase [Candidatus Omnitrophota bacterium]
MKSWQYELMRPMLSWRNKIYKKWAEDESRRLNLYQETLKEVSEYTGEPLETVRKKHHMGPRKEPTFAIFQQQDRLTVSAVENFYREATYYLYELPLWNAEKARPQYLCRIMRPYLDKFRCREVLDFGGGTGDLCLALAASGRQVAYCDIGKEVSDFARWRFQRRGLDVKMYDALDGLSGETFDAVISFDCFEHIKDLPAVVNRLSRCVRTGGLLISGDAFEGGGLHLEENFQYHNADAFDRLMQANGLSFVGRFAQFVFYRKDPGGK